MLDKEKRQEIKRLKKLKQYEEIYIRYGSKIYVKNSPRNYMRKQIKELIAQGNYEMIRHKFGKRIYKAYLPLICRDGVFKETNSKFLANSAYVGAKIINFVPLPMAAALMVTGSLYSVNREMYSESAHNNKEIIAEYNEEIQRYAEYVKSLNLSQKEIIVKVMSDIYEQYKYKFPGEEIFGYSRIYLYENGYGVCRNISDDFCAKLNAIDPSFNAHNVVCQVNSVYENGEDVHFDLMDNIERKIDVDENEENEVTQTKFEEKFIGNHMVAVITMKDEPVPMVVDPTNPGMGAVYNGGIYMFYAEKGAVESRPIATFLVTEHPFSGVFDFIDSIEFFKSYEELKEKYCPKALEQALEEVKQKEAEMTTAVVDEFGEKYRIKRSDSSMEKAPERIRRNKEDLEK